MRPVLTPTEMAAADAAAVTNPGVTVEALIEAAGAAVARRAQRMMGGTYGRRVLVVAGGGHNGADGVVAGRCLRSRGARVAVVRLGGGIHGGGFDGGGFDGGGFDGGGFDGGGFDGGGIHWRLGRLVGSADLVIDAMFGTGLSRPLAGEAAAVVAALAEHPVLSVDIPSGVDGRTGAVSGPAVRAAATVCFAALKPGLVLHPGAAHAGEVTVADIGIDVGAPKLGVTEASDVVAWLPERPPDAHKWSVGGVFVVAGAAGMTGAALLSARAALRTGAGVVVAGLPGDAAARASGTEVITRSLPATAGGSLDEAAAAEVLDGLDRFGALVLGPGLGRAAPTGAAVRRLVAEAPVPLVLDADGLNLIGGDLGLLRQRRQATVLTPHAGEYARLAGRDVGADRVASARALAAASGAVVLLKGPATVIAAPDGVAAINPTGGAALATAGTGDVLSGMIAALLAQGLDPFPAAAAAAWLHGRAGTGRSLGMVASDLLVSLPAIMDEVSRLRHLSIPPEVRAPRWHPR